MQEELSLEAGGSQTGTRGRYFIIFTSSGGKRGKGWVLTDKKIIETHIIGKREGAVVIGGFFSKESWLHVYSLGREYDERRQSALVRDDSQIIFSG